MAASSALLAFGETGERGERQGGDRGEPGEQAGAHALRGAARRGWQVVDLGPIGQQEEGVELLEAAGGAGGARRAVEIGAPGALSVQLLDPPCRARMQLRELAELDRIRRAGFGAGR